MPTIDEHADTQEFQSYAGRHVMILRRNNLLAQRLATRGLRWLSEITVRVQDGSSHFSLNSQSYVRPPRILLADSEESLRSAWGNRLSNIADIVLFMPGNIVKCRWIPISHCTCIIDAHDETGCMSVSLPDEAYYRLAYQLTQANRIPASDAFACDGTRKRDLFDERNCNGLGSGKARLKTSFSAETYGFGRGQIV